MCNPFCWLQGLVVNQVVNDDCSGFPASWYSYGCFVVVMFLCFFLLKKSWWTRTGCLASCQAQRHWQLLTGSPERRKLKSTPGVIIEEEKLLSTHRNFSGDQQGSLSVHPNVVDSETSWMYPQRDSLFALSFGLDKRESQQCFWVVTHFENRTKSSKYNTSIFFPIYICIWCSCC